MWKWKVLTLIILGLYSLHFAKFSAYIQAGNSARSCIISWTLCRSNCVRQCPVTLELVAPYALVLYPEQALPYIKEYLLLRVKHEMPSTKLECRSRKPTLGNSPGIPGCLATLVPKLEWLLRGRAVDFHTWMARVSPWRCCCAVSTAGVCFHSAKASLVPGAEQCAFLFCSHWLWAIPVPGLSTGNTFPQGQVCRRGVFVVHPALKAMSKNGDYSYTNVITAFSFKDVFTPWCLLTWCVFWAAVLSFHSWSLSAKESWYFW